MKTNLKKMISLCLVLVLALAAVPCVSADASFIKVGYEVTSAEDSSAVNSIAKGDKVNIRVTLLNNGERTTTKAIKKADSFAAPAATYSCGGSEQDYTIDFNNLTYSGEGKTLSFTLSYGTTYQDISFSIGECVENTRPQAGTAGSDFYVVGYTSSNSSISIDGTTNITLTLMRTDGENGTISLVRNVDDFKNGTEKVDVGLDGGKYVATVSGLKYRGSGNTLGFTIDYQSGGKAKYQNMTVKIAECVPYEKPSDDWGSGVTEPTAAPRAVITYSGLPELLASGETATVNISIQNTGKTAMKAPILNFTVSDSLLITDAKYTVALSDIAAGKTSSVQVPIKAFGKVTAQKQSIDVAMSFDYYNNVSTASGEASAHIIVPCKLSDGSMEEPTTGSKPVPIVILSGYSYGGASIAAGSEADLHFTFTNTSKSLAVENIVLKVTTGANLQLNGSSNTFYFENVGAGGSKSVTLPLKAVPMISGSTQDVGLSFSYEYVDDGQRRERTSEMSISVPLYQPDRLEISEPVAAYVGFVGEETSLTMDYVNKGKTEVSNVEATISGDVDSYNSFVRVGNIPSGKSGTIAFAVTPMLEGDNTAVITVTYEDANGDVKERVFETTLSAMAMEPFDPGEWDEPMEPIEEQSHFPWWIVAVAALAAAVIGIVVVSKKKKKEKLAKQQELWDEWDDDDGAGKAIDTTEAKPLPEAAATEEATK